MHHRKYLYLLMAFSAISLEGYTPTHGPTGVMTLPVMLDFHDDSWSRQAVLSVKAGGTITPAGKLSSSEAEEDIVLGQPPIYPNIPIHRTVKTNMNRSIEHGRGRRARYRAN
jgi:hypothetical protein